MVPFASGVPAVSENCILGFTAITAVTWEPPKGQARLRFPGAGWVYKGGMEWLIAVVLRPVASLVLFGLIALPVRLAVQKWAPPGRIRSLLLKRVGRGWGRYRQP